MIALIRSELLKLRTTRTALALIVGMVALIVLFTLLSGLVTDDAFLLDRNNQFQVLANGSIASAFAAVLGVLSLTTRGSARHRPLDVPRRAAQDARARGEAGRDHRVQPGARGRRDRSLVRDREDLPRRIAACRGS